MKDTKTALADRNGGRAMALVDRSVLLEERESPPALRLALVFGALVVTGFVVWSAYARLEEIETGPGEIVSAEEPVRVQHPVGGLVTEVLVREGSLVRAGDVILRVGTSESESERARIGMQLHSLRALRERLAAIIERRLPDFSFLPPEAAQFGMDQRAIYDSVGYQSRLAVGIASSQLEQATAEEERIANRAVSVARQLALAEEDASIVQGLVDSGKASRQELLAKLRAVEALKEEAASLESEAKKAAQRNTEAKARVDEYRAALSSQAKSELASVNQRILEIEAALQGLDRSAGMLDLVAPVAGFVHSLNFRTPGSIAQPGAMVAEIIPVAEGAKALVRIDPKSVGSVRVGMEVRVKVSAYPYDRYGAFAGTLTELSPTTFDDDRGRTYYRGTVDISGRESREAEELPLLPGMTLTAEMRSGSKTLLQYLLKPIFASAGDAFHEK